MEFSSIRKVVGKKTENKTCKKLMQGKTRVKKKQADKRTNQP